jgi:hypothetical protein
LAYRRRQRRRRRRPTGDPPPRATPIGNWDEDDPALLALNRRKVTDVQHLTAHRMAGHDAFVTTDHDDILRKREAIRRRTGIIVVDPAEAVQRVQGQDA